MACPMIWDSTGIYRQCWRDLDASCEECELAAINERLRQQLAANTQKDNLAPPAYNAVRQRPTFRQSSQLYGRMPWVAQRWLGRRHKEGL